MTRPRILHVIHSSGVGGGPNSVTNLCTVLKDDFDMEVVSDGAGDMPARLERAGIPMWKMALTTKWSFSAHIPQLAALVRSRKPALVHLHGQFAGSFGQLALQLAGRPRSIYTVRWPSYLDDTGPWSRFRNHAAELVSCGGATVVVAVSDHDRRELIARGLCSEGKLRVIHNSYFIEDGVGPAAAAPAPGADPKAPLVGFVGRLAPQKGCEYLIQAAPAVLKGHPDACFQLIGDGPERARLEGLAASLGVSAAVEFAGFDPHPARRMRLMSVLAVPSIYEPLGIVALEGMAMGVPVVASAVGGLPETIVDGSTGILVKPADPAALAAALVELIDSPERARRMGAAGRERALASFSPEVVSGRYGELYRELLSASS